MTLTSYGQGGGVETLSNYLEDDWGDDALTGRTNPNTGVFREQLSGGVGDLLKGIYRPAWQVESGSVSASNGELVIPAGDTTTQNATTPSRMTVGAWSWDFYFASTPGSGGHTKSILCQDVNLTAFGGSNNCYHFAAVANGDYAFKRTDGGTNTSLISASWAADTATYTPKITRTEDGDFELFKNGTSQGTATDTTFDTSFYGMFGTDSDSQQHVDNLTAN